MSLDMTNDGKYLLCVTRENGIKIVDMRQKTVINKILDEGYDREICRASFSPDGSYIVAGSTNGRMFFWNTNDVSLNKIVIDKRLESESKNFDELYSQLAHITCAIWNPEANFVVSGDTHGVITYYD
ncbi:hypothetical protein A3Q56_05654 [Intoshia linei]|uniref:Uncharacterized protein n=1 Tax=Intoshia linei TaxID=1819745 RepID=A0A177AZM0_9BILA|nr:hypothetical protein A3Q56_05654 [Intoshia linei]